MTSGRDEVEEGMHPVVPETRVTLDTRLLREDVVVLAFEVAHDFLETARPAVSTSGARHKSA